MNAFNERRNLTIIPGHELSKKGLFSLLCVKVATKGYPKKLFTEWLECGKPERGDHKVATLELTEGYHTTKMTALGWIPKAGMLKMFIGTTSCTTPGAAHEVQRTRRVAENGVWVNESTTRSTARPKLVEDLFKYFSAIDFHDRMRQGYLQLEVKWRTNCWWKRLYSTLLGMITVDAYFIYQMEYKRFNNDSDEDSMTFFDFVDALAYQLIHEAKDSGVPVTRATTSATVSGAFNNGIPSVSDVSFSP